MNASQKEFLSDIAEKNTIEYAIENGKIRLLKQLIEEGAEIDDYAVYYAAGSGNLEMVKYLIEKGAKIDDAAVKHAAEKGNLEMVKYLEIVKFLEDEKELSRSQTMIIYNKIKTGELKFPE